MNNNIVVVKGGGDVATGTIHRLYKSGFKVVALDIAKPTVIRRTVAFAQAIYDGETKVEGVTAKKAHSVSEALNFLSHNIIPVLVDERGDSIKEIKPYAVVDAILAKRNVGTTMGMAPVVIGLGPGFTAGQDVHAVIETNRGHNLGRVILNGSAEANTGVPGIIEGVREKRVIRSPGKGLVKHILKIGDIVSEGELVCYVDDMKVKAFISGAVRGLIQEGLEVTKGFKIGDIDPRGNKEYCYTISDKARAIGGAVLEAILYLTPDWP